MLVVGTPRPSSILGDVADNGFFEKLEPHTAGGVQWESLDEDDIELADPQGRDSRTRSESFHEMYDEKAKLPPIVLAGTQPLLTRQLNIVTALSGGTSERSRPWDAPSREELADEEQLEREEAGMLDRWRGIGGRGRPDLPPPAALGGIDTRKAPSGRRKSNANSSSALVPSMGNVEGNQELLPRYEDAVRILVLSSLDASAQLVWRTTDLSDAGGRRVHCHLWELHPEDKMDDALLESYVRGSDAVIVAAVYSEFAAKALHRAVALDRVAVVTGAFGTSPADAKRLSQRISPTVHFDAKGTTWTEIATRDVVLKNARLRGERKTVLLAMEKQLKRMERGKSGGGCSLM